MDKCFFSYCEDEALKIKVEGMPVHRFFSPEGFMLFGLEPKQGNYREKSNGGYAQIIDMPIDEFLGLAEPIPDCHRRRVPSIGQQTNTSRKAGERKWL